MVTHDMRAHVDETATASEQWTDSTRIVLQPVAPPSILGLFGFTASTFIVAAQLAGWYGNSHSAVYLAPFAAVFGGVAQFAAAMWSYRARDAVATAVHGAWGSFWIAYGLLFLLVAVGAVTVPAGRFPELGFWFVPLAAITFSCAMASLGDNLAITVTLIGLTAGAALLAIAYLTGSSAWLHTAGWELVIDAACAFYAGSAMMLHASYGRVILPTGQPSADANVPGRRTTRTIQLPDGEPGVRHGQ